MSKSPDIDELRTAAEGADPELWWWSEAVIALCDYAEHLEQLSKQAICAYCGHIGEKDGKAMVDHIAECVEHPVGKVWRENQQLLQIAEEANADSKKLCDECDRLRKERNDARQQTARWIPREREDGAHVLVCSHCGREVDDDHDNVLPTVDEP